MEDLPLVPTLRRMVVRLDCAWMLYRREANAGQDALASWRYISFGASPQGGQEIYILVERMVARGADGQLTVQQNKLPIAVLGVGRIGPR